MVQLLVVLAIIAVAAAILIPTVARVRAASRSTGCLSNLRGLAMAFRLYAAENGDRLPSPAVTEIPWERSLAQHAADGMFVCPGDNELLGPATGSSYDWRDTGIAATTLAGRGLARARPEAVLAFDALPAWHAKGQMNVVRVDGGAGAMRAAECIADLMQPVDVK